jgi:lipoprotein-anchoring transpeptidase ErfK/SrfK
MSATLVQEARTALEAGQKQQARLLLQQAIRENPQDYAAWLWLASVTPSPRASLDYVKRAAMLRPGDMRIKKALAWAEKRVQEADAKREERTEASGTEQSRLVWLDQLRQWSGQTAVMRTALILIALILIATITMSFLGDSSGRGQTAELPIAANQQSIIAAAATSTPEPVAPTATATATPQLIKPKSVISASDGPRPTWTVTPTPTNTPSPTPTYAPTFVSDSGGVEVSRRPLGVAADERWIDVDLSSQVLRAYEGNEMIFETFISSGTYDHPTVTGQFRIWLKYEAQTMDGARLGYDYYLENVPYVMYFYQDYALHGTFWHNNFGTPMSHGCVNMETGDAQWVFSWAGVGTVVNVHY